MMRQAPLPPSQIVVAESAHDLRDSLLPIRRSGQTIGFVPTMGALHPGHISLIQRAKQECDQVVVSIFVNPTQFGPHEDFQKYPRPRDQDLQICSDAGANFAFYPGVDDIYPPGFRTIVEVQGLSDVFEGAVRPGHFRGVTTIVTKLFMIVGADKAFFGQKDYQQQLLIRIMARDLNIPTEVITCPTLRDPDGLAMSSRNAYLSVEERQRGLCLSRALRRVEQLVKTGEREIATLQSALREEILSTEGVSLDYAVIVDPETLVELNSTSAKMVGLVAARIGTTRLIDNVVLN